MKNTFFYFGQRLFWDARYMLKINQFGPQAIEYLGIIYLILSCDSSALACSET